jgi:hypothetical protein
MNLDALSVRKLISTQPWSSPKNLPVSTLPKVESRPEFAQDHESGLRSEVGPAGTSSSICDFFEVAILEITIRFFKFVWEILPIRPAIQPPA